MKIKCIASDMDGTLLSGAHVITSENKEAILKAQSQGIEFVVATGRSYEEAEFALKDAGIQCPIICVNGAEVRSSEGKIIGQNPIAKPEANDIAKLLHEMGVYFEVYTDYGTYTNDREKGLELIVDIFLSINPGLDRNYVKEESKKRFDEGHIKVVNNYDELFEGEKHQILKLLAFSFDDEKLEKASKVLGGFSSLAISSSAKGNLEITNVNAQKGIALQQFVEKRGITLAETMALGDNFNDVSMFKLVGRAVAMGNAAEEIKALCDYVTATNEESGVGKAILEAMKES
jgi:Cof subfamily protein (haloacid dehalogenase superfamily)